MDGAVLSSVAIAAVTVSLYALLVVALGRRSVSPEGQPALEVFRVWWAALAVTTLVRPVQTLLFQAGALPVWLYQVFAQLSVLALCVGLWALLCYLVYLYRGSRRMWRGLAVAYALYAVLLLAFVAWSRPATLVEEFGRVEGRPEPALSESFEVGLLVTLVGPQLAAAIAYLRLYWRVDDPTARYRIALVASSILVWFGGVLVAGALQVQAAWWQVVSQSLGLGAALVVLMAYFPPTPLRRRYGLRSLA